MARRRASQGRVSKERYVAEDRDSSEKGCSEKGLKREIERERELVQERNII